MSTAIKTAWVFTGALFFFAAVIVFGLGVGVVDSAFATYSYPKIQDKIEAADAHGWQFLLSDGYTVTAPYEVWKQHQPGDRLYVEQHRSFISRRDVLADGN